MLAFAYIYIYIYAIMNARRLPAAQIFSTAVIYFQVVGVVVVVVVGGFLMVHLER